MGFQGLGSVHGQYGPSNNHTVILEYTRERVRKLCSALMISGERMTSEVTVGTRRCARKTKIVPTNFLATTVLDLIFWWLFWLARSWLHRSKLHY
jgi:hypothetical protein